MYPSPINHHSNITSRIALRIQNLPEWSVDWNDETPQCSWQSLTTVDFMPTEEDARKLEERAIHYIMRFLVREFPGLEDLKSFVPEEEIVHSVQKSEVVPMKVLLKMKRKLTRR